MEKSNGKSVRTLTVKQAKILAKMRSESVKNVSTSLNISPDAIYMSNTRIYQRFVGLVDVMLENFPVFERRFKKNPTAYNDLRRLARLVKGEVKAKKLEETEGES